MKTIEYPLLATTFTKKELDQVMQPILQIGLPKSGICRNMARDAIFASKKYLGFDLSHPYITQGVRKVLLFLSNEHKTTSALLQIAWESTVLECGLGPTFLCEKGKAIRRVITNTWMTSLWEFIETHHIVLKNHTAQETKRFPQDFYLMKEASIILSKADLRHFNYCRIFLQLNLYSDMLTADGRRVRQEIMQGNRTNNIMIGYHQWPKQPRPSEKIWRLWRLTLQRLIPMGDNGIVNVPHVIIWNRNWSWFLSQVDNRLYELRDDGVYVHAISRRTQRRATRSCKRFCLQCTRTNEVITMDSFCFSKRSGNLH
jgi:hypothetical protein